MGRKPDSEITNVSAENGSVAVGGGVYAPVVVNNNNLEDMKEALRSVMAESAAKSITASQVDIDQALQGEFDQFIDEYKRKIEAGKVKTALELFNDLYSRKSAKLTPIQIFRIKANIAICHLNLGGAQKAADLLHEACNFAPDEPKAIANRVLAYLLEGNIERGYSLAVDCLKTSPNNEWLAANALHAARACSDDGQVYELIGNEAKECECVCAAYVEYLASRRAENFRQTANDYLEKFPQNYSIRNVIALNELEAIVNAHNEEGSSRFPIDKPEKLDNAVAVLEESWNSFESSERIIHPADEADANNLLICYALQANIKKLSEFCLNFINKYPTCEKLIELITQISLDFQLDEVFERAVPLLSDETAQRKYRFVKILHARDWSELAKLQDYIIEKLDKSLKDAAKVAKFIAQAKQGMAKGKIELERLIAEEEISPRAQYTLYELAVASEIKPILQIAYTYGLAAVSSNSDISHILSFCRVAQKLHDWRKIIELLRGTATPTENSEETRLIALAYVNDYPIRESAVRFFDELVSAQHGSEHFLLLSGIFSYKNKDFSSAKKYLNEYLEAGGKEAYSLLSLTDIARLESDNSELERLLNKYGHAGLSGEPAQIIHIAKLQTVHGDAKKGLELGYKTYIENSKNPEVALGYTHIFLFSGKRIEIESINTVSPGVWFTLISSDGAILERTVEENYEDILQLDPESLDEYTSKVYGLKVGEFFIQKKLHSEITWTVSEIKHKYLRAFHYILANYETDFPNAGGLWAIKMEGDDIQPILDLIKKSSEHDQNVLEQLCSQRFPLSAMSKIWHKHVIKIADMARLHNGEIFTCIGGLEERQQAYAQINEFAKNGIVLDTYTAWVASSSKTLEILKESFGKLYVGRSTIVELLHLCEEVKGLGGSSMSIGWMKGEFQRTINSDEDRDALIAEIQRRIKLLEDLCIIESYNFPETIDKLTDQIIENLGAEILEPYFIAMKHQAIFCSDDFCSRDFAKGLFRLNASTWLQPLLDIAKARGDIDLPEYCTCIVSLAFYRHSHIALVPNVLEQVYQDDKTAGLYEFSAIAKYIGVKNAEVSSHYKVTELFLGMRWYEDVTPGDNPAVLRLLISSVSESHPVVKAMKATSIIIENFIRVPDGLKLLTTLADMPALRISDYIYGWIEGHFLTS
ncbi:tetratricopeptide repeat protein [Pseudomonas aeruginosa]|uniref:tetratricopeptide repeat protein n=1 Tax=Pseudomonas aeruginosa TaxID=287 RepID=UPI000A58DFF3|nr:hypothetical protein [Pseudomonas aeruginosa]MDV6777022.1 hypothetical protein [Pseudomonas aeruginosa]